MRRSRMNEMNVEIRDDRLHISGYVNVVERDSKIINTRDGRCVEQIAAGAFARSLSDGHEVRMKHNHRRDIGSTSDGTIITLKEDNVGLYAETVTDDEELRELAAKGELKGWSFGFVKREGSMEERGAAEVPRRHITALDLTEISILSVTPAYNGNSVEMRTDEEVRSYEDYEYNIQAHGYNGEIKAIVETARHEEEDNGNVTAIIERTFTDESGTTTTKEKRETVHKDDKEALKAKVQVFLMKEKIKDLKREQRDMELRYAIRQAKEHQAELEERYNHYHDPHNGRFASGAGGGAGLYYSMGKGKGEIIGASSPWQPKKREGLFLPSDLKAGDVIDPDIYDSLSKYKKNGKKTSWNKTKSEGLDTWKSELYSPIIVENVKVGNKTTKITGFVDRGDYMRDNASGSNYGKYYSRYTKVVNNSDLIRIYPNKHGMYHLPSAGAEVRNYFNGFA